MRYRVETRDTSAASSPVAFCLKQLFILYSSKSFNTVMYIAQSTLHVNSLALPALISISTVCASNYILALLRACEGGRYVGFVRTDRDKKSSTVIGTPEQ